MNVVKRNITASMITVLALFCLQGCHLGPDYSEPEFDRVLQDEWQTTEFSLFTQDEQPAADWWQQFNDKTLSSLIEQLYTSNLSLAQARERIAEANARQGVIGSEKRLQLAADLGYTRAETGDEAVSMQGIAPGKTLDVYSAGLVAGWELDLWGRVDRLLESGEQDIRASYADYQALMVSLSAELTLTYIEIRAVEARIEKVRENIELQEKTLSLAQSRFDAGNGSALEIARTKRLISATKARIPELERELQVARNRIKVLLGLSPEAENVMGGALPKVPQMIGLGLPVDLVSRRPDIQKAVYAYHGAVARIGAAEAEKYPTFSISGTLTLSSDSLGGVFDTDSLIYTLGPGVHFPILTGNRIKANIAVRESQAEQLRLGLEQQIIQSLSEVENAAVGVVRSQQRTQELAEAEAFGLRSVALSEELYQAGLVPLYQVLDNQQQLVAIQESLLLAKQQALSGVVTLYRALGGGWTQISVKDSNE